MNSEELTNNIITPLSLCTLDVKVTESIWHKCKLLDFDIDTAKDIVRVETNDTTVSWDIYLN